MDTFVQKIEQLVSIAWNIKGPKDYESWSNRATSFLSSAVDNETAEAFTGLGGSSAYLYWGTYRDRQVGHLEGLALRIEAKGLRQEQTEHRAITQSPVAKATNRIFLVHGHDVAAKESSARFIEKLGLEPVILHEQANEGRTIIEKFEVYADAGFAVVLLTPDDVGASSSDQTALHRELDKTSY